MSRSIPRVIINRDYNPPGDVLSAFMRSPARRRVIMGPFGSGKSTVCCMEIGRRARDQAPGPDGVRRTRFAVVRNTYPELKSTTLKTWRMWFGDELGSAWRDFTATPPFEHRIRYVVPDDGTRVHADVLFLALDQESDAKKFLSLEVTGIWFNEVREIKRAIVEAGDGRIGRYPSMAMGGPTWHGIIADTNMPEEDHWLHDLAESERPQGWAFFRQPGGVIKQAGAWVANPNAENHRNLVPGYYTAQLPGKSEPWISVYLAAEYGRLPPEGAYFAEELMATEREKRIGDVPHDPELPVHTFWDLGIADDTAIWFGQAVGSGQGAPAWRWIDYYENSGHALDHFARVLKEKAQTHRWVYGDHVWPHDGGHRDPGILGAKTRREVFEGLGFKTILLPRHGLADGIEAARRLIRMSRFDAVACREGLKKLRRYRRDIDPARGVYQDTPRHDENSHAADAFRTAAMGQGRISNASAWTNTALTDAGEWVV
ncbi:MAG: terminase family protein [Rhodospirillaceae bacterium]|nr:terminase family protein [Rhodospirillaceae bacterium]